MKKVLKIGNLYSRYSISDLLNESDQISLNQKELEQVTRRIKFSQEGIVHVRELNSYLLFVDLVKEGKEAVEAVEIGGGIGGIPIVVFVILGILLITFMRR